MNNDEDVLEDNKISTLSEIIEAIQDDQLAVSEVIEELAPAEIARALESLPPAERDQVWESVDETVQGEVLANLGGEVLDDVIEDMSTEVLAHAVEDLDNDDLVDILHDLPEEKALELLQIFDAEQRGQLLELLDYEDNTAGGMMNTDTITVRADTPVKVAIRYLRRLEEIPSATTKLFVVDRNATLLGEVLLSQLIVGDKSAPIEAIMKDSKAIAVDADNLTVAQIFREHDLVATPVVNADGQLLGRITVDDVIDVIQEEADRVLLNSAGLDEEADTFAPIRQAAISRGVWLGINLLTALLAASVINAFGATIEKVVALAALSPLVASMGGIAGSQSLTIIIRGIALGQIEGANAKLLLMRELTIGLINGVVWGLVTALISLWWFGQLNLALIVISAIFTNLCFAALSGVLIPLLLKRLNIDPALAGSVILTTVTDVVGFMVLLGLATLFL